MCNIKGAYVLPILRGAANNQVAGLKEVLGLAALINRTVILPHGLFEHSLSQELVDITRIVQLGKLFDVTRLRRSQCVVTAAEHERSGWGKVVDALLYFDETDKRWILRFEKSHDIVIQGKPEIRSENPFNCTSARLAELSEQLRNYPVVAVVSYQWIVPGVGKPSSSITSRIGRALRGSGSSSHHDRARRRWLQSAHASWSLIALRHNKAHATPGKQLHRQSPRPGAGAATFRRLVSMLAESHATQVQNQGQEASAVALVPPPITACQSAYLTVTAQLRKSSLIRNLARNFIEHELQGQPFAALHVRPWPDKCLMVWIQEEFDEHQAKKVCKRLTGSLHGQLVPGTQMVMKQMRLGPGQVFVLSHPSIRHQIRKLYKQVDIQPRFIGKEDLLHAGASEEDASSVTLLALVEEEVAVEASVFVGTDASSMTAVIIQGRLAHKNNGPSITFGALAAHIEGSAQARHVGQPK
eukprot:CAMPEP_0202913134 /NCGR_PEP_ID=MMETSP1392-20130828/59645_1 /ASSEMBLY_ACC=CAM_ASM_000868 /TAXON_ID=225041 /ORGANISM="Chlamydomonas chlamydogama, Strain SAG 11-48b" /LENGTH=469 /DNA_ID=CAMNT_0049604277 /DNA_START=191 /DNA_END=1601 /DNA_ORIENTATION=-